MVLRRSRRCGLRRGTPWPGPPKTEAPWAIFGISARAHHNLLHSMSGRGNFHDNAVAESFFNFLKRERSRKVCRSRGEARRDILDYIKML